MSNNNGGQMVKYTGRSGVVLRDTPPGSTPEQVQVVAYVDDEGRQIPIQPFPMSQTTEQKLGQRNWRQQAGGRIYAPEAANADIALTDPNEYFASADSSVTGVIALDGELEVVRMDYNSILNMQYIRDAAATIGALGRNDQASYALAAASPVGALTPFVFQAFSSPNLILGFEIQWGITLLNATAFNMDVDTYNFKGQNLQVVDRHFQVRTHPTKQAGGTFQFLFANRSSGSSPGYYYNGVGGMNLAIVQPAQLPALSGLATDAPYLSISVPTALASNVTFYGRVISAASPALANLRERTAEFMIGT